MFPETPYFCDLLWRIAVVAIFFYYPGPDVLLLRRIVAEFFAVNYPRSCWEV